MEMKQIQIVRSGLLAAALSIAFGFAPIATGNA
jgi:hypothetical protein